MKKIIFLFCLFSLIVTSQTSAPFSVPEKSILYTLKLNDSITYYQCHVEQAVQQLSTAGGQTLTSNSKKFTITEKYVIVKTDSVTYNVKYYTSSLIAFPNRKFSGLKIREKKYWEFRKENEFKLTQTNLKYLIALESKGRETTEYDFAITKYTTNQLIIKTTKQFKQLVIDGDYVLSQLFKK